MAAPLLEEAQVWRSAFSKEGVFPRSKIGAYNFRSKAGEIEFRTGRRVSAERVWQEVKEWSGMPPRPAGKHIQPIPPLDHKQVLAELKQKLQRAPVQIEERIGLSLQRLQQDLAELRPALVLLYCHGTPEGCLLFEDGWARAEFVPGERLFPLFQPKPRVLFLNACHSESVLKRAKQESVWEDSAIVYIDAATPVEVGASAAFQAMFYTALLRGENTGAAYDSARRYVANDSLFGDLSVASSETHPSAKFRIYPEDCQAVCLTVPAGLPDALPQGAPVQPRSRRISRAAERFVGRCREMARCIDALLPLPPGVHYGPGEERRLVTLTKEGGIGKTALALEIVDWVEERELFAGRIVELPCEGLNNPKEWLSRLLSLLGLPPEDQRGDLLELFAVHLAQQFPPEKPALLVLDNLDDLFERQAKREAREEAEQVLAAALTAAPTLRVLATCRWPLGLADHEAELEIPPLDEDEARDVFLSHLQSTAHQSQVEHSWQQPDSAVRQLIRLSGYHPQSLRLLARQMGRKGMTLERLRDEAYADLLEVLVDPLALDNETNRLKKVEASYQLSYRHLSEPGKHLFERLSRLPGGVWCGESAEDQMNWHELLGEGWRETLDELNYYALVHYEPDALEEGGGRYVMLPSMLEFARQKYRAADQQDWEASWIASWQQRLGLWNELISGRTPAGLEIAPEQRGAFGTRARHLAEHLFAQTEANWLAVFEAVAGTNDGPTLRWFLLVLVDFLQLSGQRVLLRVTAEQAVKALRVTGPEEDLAPCLVTLGTVLRDLGERAAARAAFEEALTIHRRLAGQHPAAFEADVATTLNNLGTVLRDLGERAAARAAYEEALVLYMPFFERWPQAFGHNFLTVLRNYTASTEENEQDPWWQMWRSLRGESDGEKQANNTATSGRKRVRARGVAHWLKRFRDWMHGK